MRLDGQLQRWEGAALARQEAASPVLEQRRFVYLKYWKPVGVTSTSDPTDPTNIIRAGGFDLFPQRLFTVGRLDKDSSGLILLTSDGRVNNALLSPGRKREKSYEVTMNRCPTAEQVARLAAGVEITTTAQRDGRARELTRPTLPCKVARIGTCAQPYHSTVRSHAQRARTADCGSRSPRAATGRSGAWPRRWGWRWRRCTAPPSRASRSGA